MKVSTSLYLAMFLSCRALSCKTNDIWFMPVKTCGEEKSPSEFRFLPLMIGQCWILSHIACLCWLSCLYFSFLFDSSLENTDHTKMPIPPLERASKCAFNFVYTPNFEVQGWEANSFVFSFIEEDKKLVSFHQLFFLTCKALAE